ncbi:hypothetical protein PR003_g7911 [Phytophthora rubi]|uniref:Uncharacterized protein n=1 Tax=Phytophthora rubi TaxID=129364 RepID=A0A6A4FCP3_9STRA|nr:hypothetical protein PR001_g25956 [Phytophthora rubi]KAE8998232.1 hypothetical protein PR002_g18794 [Phytophthora rubi]KAE9345519.1 hypothetical protein PR003_g7911 [Phytophthora rubi]
MHDLLLHVPHKFAKVLGVEALDEGGALTVVLNDLAKGPTRIPLPPYWRIIRVPRMHPPTFSIVLTQVNWKFSRVASSQLPRVQSWRVSNGDLDSEWHKNGTLESVDWWKIAKTVNRITYRLTGTEASHPKQRRFGMEL